ncbi:hypothetical protein CDL12_02002 [Handroanthus impetiginosus]|uniref:Uncharacterized protein n=1 Tax=Handroanthus impetiginosus TaxID=429701 RepID=A0A2G9I686_9LAMI|nr:hypothetical protein CDL12_02002 [Handroanthus impetiginosus]
MEDSVDSYRVGARNCDEQEGTSDLVHTQATESKDTEWTDEKHSLYLKSMEATFVNQLYKSFGSFGRSVHKNCPSGSKSLKHKPAAVSPSSQFKVLRDGCWSKIDFRRDDSKINKGESGGVSASPWIQHYRCSERPANRKFSASRAKAPLATTANQDSAHDFELWLQDSVGSNTEVTDQNFNDEDLEEEKSGRIHEIKRTRTSTEAAPSNDQVVPFENIDQVDDVA